MSSCNDRRKLAEQFALATREYSEAVARLVQHEGPPSDAEYGALRSVVNETHERCEIAGVEFEQHVAAHGSGVIMNKSRLAKSAHASASASIGP
jgi:hypothetical protein